VHRIFQKDVVLQWKNNTKYTYDAENCQLTHEKTADAAAELHQYAYDYRTRRVFRDESGAGGGLSLISVLF
jgi:hypothetical protein